MILHIEKDIIKKEQDAGEVTLNIRDNAVFVNSSRHFVIKLLSEL